MDRHLICCNWRSPLGRPIRVVSTRLRINRTSCPYKTLQLDFCSTLDFSWIGYRHEKIITVMKARPSSPHYSNEPGVWFLPAPKEKQVTRRIWLLFSAVPSCQQWACLGGSGIKSGEEQGETSKAQSSGQRWLTAIHLWFQDSESADRSGSPGAGLWAVTTDTQTNQELSLKRYQLDRVTGDGKTG